MYEYAPKKDPAVGRPAPVKNRINTQKATGSETATTRGSRETYSKKDRAGLREKKLMSSHRQRTSTVIVDANQTWSLDRAKKSGTGFASPGLVLSGAGIRSTSKAATCT